jgi:hypothetical protein
MAAVEWIYLREVNMKRSFIRIAIVASLMMAMVLGALPLQAQPQPGDRDRDDSPYYSQSRDNSDRRDNGSYRDDNNNSYRRNNDSYRGQDDSNRARNDSYRGQDDSDRAWNPRSRQVYYRQPEPRPVYNQSYDQRDFQQHRSVGQSALIVGGSAAAGAGIGALAGGGKGAGIGAIAGGLGGFIYDRLTANHR